MKRITVIFIALFLLTGVHVFAQDDVLIDESGNVITGNSNVNGGNLEVLTTGEDGIVSITNGADKSGIYGQNEGSGYGVQGLSNTGIGGYFNSNSGPGLVVGSGNVGIGTLSPSPAYNLDVVGTINASTAIKINGTDVLTSYTETDPTVNALGKAALSCGSGQVAKWNGADWVCADDVDTNTTYTAGTGLDLAGTTFNLEVPLTLVGSVTSLGVLSVTNSSPGSYGSGVYGYSSGTGAITNYGGLFQAAGDYGQGVYGSASGSYGNGVVGNASGSYGTGVYGVASNTGSVTNYGGHFEAHGDSGRGVQADVTGTSGIGVFAYASGTNGTGVVSQAYGANGIGVNGLAASYGAVTNYGGYFSANGETGRGVYGYADGTDGIGVYGLSNTGTGGYFTSNSGNGLIVENGFVGIGTTSPSAIVEVARDQFVPRILATGYRNAFSAGDFTGRKARGTMASPSAVQTDDVLASFGGYGYYYDPVEGGGWPTGSATVKARMLIVAAENWTDDAQGAYISFFTTPIGYLERAEVMRITDAGNVGVGTMNPGYKLDVAGTINASTAIKVNGVDVLTSNTETDPIFGLSAASGISAGDITNWNAAFGWGDHAGAGYLTSETDPTVNALGKAVLSCASGQVAKWNGSNWVCANDADSDTTYSAGTGLDLTGTTFSVELPLALSGSLSSQGILSGINSNASGYGVEGTADAIGGVTNYGGYFSASGNFGRGVYGTADATGAVTNYGGYFSAGGDSGRGVYGSASGTNGYGLYGSASGSSAYGVYGTADATGASANYGGYFRALGNSGHGVYGYASATGAVTNTGGYFRASGDAGTGVFGTATATGAVSNTGGYFNASGDSGRGVLSNAIGSSGIGVYSIGGQYDFYAAGSGTNYAPFTGAHEVRLSTNFPSDIKPGMVVSVTGKALKRHKEDGSLSFSSTLPTVILSLMENDKAVFGVLVMEGPLPRDHWYKASPGERFGVVNALGEGRVWVTNIKGNITAGDYITTSVIPGYGQRQEDDLLHSYTLGKVIETVDWDAVTETLEYNGQIIKVYPIAVVYTSG